MQKTARRARLATAVAFKPAYTALGPIRTTVWQPARDALAPPLRSAVTAIGAGLRPLAARLPSPMRRATLAQRIFVYNLAGLLILIGGMIYLNRHQDWLINAKRESLIAQGKIIAVAVADRVTASADDNDGDVDPLEGRVSKGLGAPYPMSELVLSIGPDVVGPVLKALVEPTGTRVRIYGGDGTYIIDSDTLLARGQVIKRRSDGEERPPLSWWQRTWSRLTVDNDIPVYTEIGTGNGKHYDVVRLALTSRLTEYQMMHNDERQRVVTVAVPILRNELLLGALMLVTRGSDIDSLIAKERRLIITVSLLALLATAIASMALSRTIAGPMRKMAEAAEDLSITDANIRLSARATLPDYSWRRDEIGQMSAAFNGMVSSLLKRIDASDKFAADTAHELRNPVAAISGITQALAFAKSEEQRAELVKLIGRDLARLDRLIDAILSASRIEGDISRSPLRPIDLVTLLDAGVHGFNELLGRSGRKVVLDIADPDGGCAYVVNGHEVRLGQVVTNLVENAISFSPPDGIVTVRAHRVGGMIEVAIEDEGPGIPPDKLEKVFERFYTDRPETEATDGKNSGLGLAIAREIMSKHYGQLWAENRGTPGRSSFAPLPDRLGRKTGARFIFRLPAADARSGPPIGSSG